MTRQGSATRFARGFLLGLPDPVWAPGYQWKGWATHRGWFGCRTPSCYVNEGVEALLGESQLVVLRNSIRFEGFKSNLTNCFDYDWLKLRSRRREWRLALTPCDSKRFFHDGRKRPLLESNAFHLSSFPFWFGFLRFPLLSSFAASQSRSLLTLNYYFPSAVKQQVHSWMNRFIYQERPSGVAWLRPLPSHRARDVISAARVTWSRPNMSGHVHSTRLNSIAFN